MLASGFPVEAEDGDYSVLVHDQASGAKRLRSDGVLDQLCSALLAYANKPGRTKTYEPEAIKRLLKQSDPTWKSEVRVPPYDSQYDNLPINERFDLFRVVSDDHGSTYGVGVEIEQWEIQNDLLKIRRAIHRGQVGVGAIILGSASNLDYAVSHLPVNEPLFLDLPIAFIALQGPGFRLPSDKPARAFKQPYLFPPSA